MGPLGKVGTHHRPLEIRAQKYVNYVKGEGGRTPAPLYQPETLRWGRMRQPSWTEGSIGPLRAGMAPPASPPGP